MAVQKTGLPMFCYQCEQTSRGKACVEFGVCGKDSNLSALQDLLVYQLEGLSFYAQGALGQGKSIRPQVHRFVIDALFATLTNVNFVSGYFTTMLRRAQEVKDELRALAGRTEGPAPLPAVYRLPAGEDDILRDAYAVSIRPFAAVSEDLQSLKDTLLFGLKGMAAYAYHAWVLGYTDETVNRYFYRGLSSLADASVDGAASLGMLLEFGQVNLRCMQLLDQANTTTFGHPTPVSVPASKKKGPFIVVSGHDLHDLKQLLEQSEGRGVNIYTHGEMLPAHGYPELKKYAHLAGNYGTAWQNQQREFNDLPGCILMTTNCLVEPRDSYKDRLYTTGVVGWEGVAHIDEVDGRKDFTPIIEQAIALGGWPEDEPLNTVLTTGFARSAVLSHAPEIISAVKSGQISRFFLVGGCDGARPGRNYYTEFAEQAPDDSIILTLACGKYRFNHLDLGTVAGLPRLLDIGQCNDAYSAIQIALALADAFECGVNDLPLTLVLSWFEQKAVCILLTLLSLGIKNIYLGPTLPAFITPGVLAVLAEQYGIRPITAPEEDLKAILA